MMKNMTDVVLIAWHRAEHDHYRKYTRPER